MGFALAGLRIRRRKKTTNLWSNMLCTIGPGTARERLGWDLRELRDRALGRKLLQAECSSLAPAKLHSAASQGLTHPVGVVLRAALASQGGLEVVADNSAERSLDCSAACAGSARPEHGQE